MEPSKQSNEVDPAEELEVLRAEIKRLREELARLREELRRSRRDHHEVPPHHL
jgi:hypothetical protein